MTRVPLMKLTAVTIVFAAALIAGSVRHAAAQASITVESPAFKAGDMLPKDYAGDGRNVSPPLTWKGVPTAAKQLVLISEDPEGGNPPPVVHWVLYGIPATVTGVPEDVPPGATVASPASLAGAMQGIGARRSGEPGYRGPSPPLGVTHHYHFIVYALDAALDLKPGLDRAGVLQAISGHIIGKGEIVAAYQRQPQ